MQGGTIPGALPRANEDPPGRRPEHQDRASVGPEIGGAGELHFGPWLGGPDTTLLASSKIPWNEGLDVADVLSRNRETTPS